MMKPTRVQRMQVINIQIEISILGHYLVGVIQFIYEQTLSLTITEGAAIELAEDCAMVYQVLLRISKSQCVLRRVLGTRLSGQRLMNSIIERLLHA